VFANVVGGLQVNEPAADLATAVAIGSSLKDSAVPADLAFVGEVGLSGELRAVPQLPSRLREASKLGFRRVLVPKTVLRSAAAPEGIEVHAVRSLSEALSIALGGK
jgi:DNA repair protein RadA/Sms